MQLTVKAIISDYVATGNDKALTENVERYATYLSAELKARAEADRRKALADNLKDGAALWASKRQGAL